MSRKSRLSVLALEDRTVPATFGAPWSDSTHLTLSVAPDGTPIAGHVSNLNQALNAQFPAGWQGEMLRALQDWASVANISVGVVTDGGQPVGTPGLGQGHARFGDIRIRGAADDATVLAVSVPHDPFFGGTWSGDVFVNTAYDFTSTQTNLYSVFLHEFGHVFGLDNSTDPNSVMYGTGNTPHPGLSTSDLANLRALYGPRRPDAF